MTKRENVIVATDLGPDAMTLVTEGVRIASQLDADVVVVHVHQPTLLTTPLFPQRQQNAALEQSDRRRAVEGDLVRIVAAMESDIVTWRLLEGEPIEQVLGVVRELQPFAIIVGRGIGALGTIAGRLVHRAPCVIFLVPGSESGVSGGPVLAATDLTDPTSPAIRAGAMQASLRGVPLEVMHVVGHRHRLLPSHWLSLDVDPEPADDREVEEAEHALEDELHWLDIDATVNVEIGDAAACVTSRANDIDAQLIVVGSTGRAGMRRFVLGHVADTIVRTAACTVMVTRLRRDEKAAAERRAKLRSWSSMHDPAASS